MRIVVMLGFFPPDGRTDSEQYEVRQATASARPRRADRPALSSIGRHSSRAAQNTQTLAHVTATRECVLSVVVFSLCYLTIKRQVESGEQATILSICSSAFLIVT